MPTVELPLYGLIGTEEGEISARLVKQVLSELDDGTDLIVELHTEGGSVVEGLAIYRLLESFPGHVTMRIVNAVSIGSVIALAGDECEIVPTGRVMIHEPEGGSHGRANVLGKDAELVKTFLDDMVKIYVEKTNLDEKTIRSMLDSEAWFRANEAVEAGFADRISGANVSAKLDISKFKNAPKYELVAEKTTPAIGAGKTSDEKKVGDIVTISVKSLKQKFPKATSDFIVRAMEEELTEEEVTAAYIESMEEENASLKAMVEELESKVASMEEELAAKMDDDATAMDDDATAEEDEEVMAVSARRQSARAVAGVSSGVQTRAAESIWKEKVSLLVDKGVDRIAAVKRVARENPGLHQRLIAEANKK